MAKGKKREQDGDGMSVTLAISPSSSILSPGGRALYKAAEAILDGKDTRRPARPRRKPVRDGEA